MPASPLIEITYCRLCGWGLRAGWMAQEPLATFAADVGSVALTPDCQRRRARGPHRRRPGVVRKETGRFPRQQGAEATRARPHRAAARARPQRRTGVGLQAAAG